MELFGFRNIPILEKTELALVENDFGLWHQKLQKIKTFSGDVGGGSPLNFWSFVDHAPPQVLHVWKKTQHFYTCPKHT